MTQEKNKINILFFTLLYFIIFFYNVFHKSRLNNLYKYISRILKLYYNFFLYFTDQNFKHYNYNEIYAAYVK